LSIFFWEQYNLESLNQLQALLDKDQYIYYVDLHTHSDFSADGKQTVQDIIERAAELQFDVISITDHDSVQAYHIIKDIVREYSLIGRSIPIIIPGIEFTVRYKEYGDMCHILKYGFNPESTALKNNLENNIAAFWRRAERQFDQIERNQTLNYFSNQYHIHFSISEYEQYLKACKVSTPEYPSLISYIHAKLEPCNIPLGEIVSHIEQDIKSDPSETRAKLRTLAINRFKSKYKHIFGSSMYPSRLLSPLFSVRGIDDEDYPEHDTSGNLSIRNYGQLEINELFKEGITVFAHPNGDKLHLMRDCLNMDINLCALELNKRNRHATMDHIKTKAEELGLFVTRGSDNHEKSNQLYEEMSFYETSKTDLMALFHALKKSNEARQR